MHKHTRVSIPVVWSRGLLLWQHSSLQCAYLNTCQSTSKAMTHAQCRHAIEIKVALVLVDE